MQGGVNMKILYLVHQFYPEHYTSTGKFIFNVSSMMQKCDNNARIITYMPGENFLFNRESGSFLIRDYIYKGISVTAIKHRSEPEDMNHALHNKDMRDFAKGLIIKEDPDVVHIGHPMRLSEMIRILPDLNIPYVFTLTDYFMMCPKGILINHQGTLCPGPKGGDNCPYLCPEFNTNYIRNRLGIAREILYSARLLVSPSQFLADLFNSEFQDLNVRVMPHGINYGFIKRNESKYAAGDMITFTYAGALNLHEGVHVLISAFKKVRSDRAVLNIYGSGNESYKEQIMKDASEDSRINFCGVYSEDTISNVLTKADVLIVPSLWYENYPLVLHEALASNVPVITSDAGGMSERISHGFNGLLFKMGDSECLKELLQAAVDDPAILNSLKRNINYMVSPTVEQEAYKYERIYKTILKDETYI
jgi:glycosyltransferase involved in cell wall biosynthesis